MNQDQKREFKEKGYLQLKNFVPKEIIEYLAQKVDEELVANKDEFGAQLNRLKYNFLSDDAKVLDFVNTADFQRTLGGLTEKDLFYIQGIGFEIKEKYDSGFPWHIGKGSFTYQFLEDYGCTLWIPLAKINTKKQHGGMAYVPKNVISGEFAYQLFQGSFQYLSRETDMETAKKKYYDMNKLSSIEDFLEFYKVEDDFELGDALLFDKYVLHRSNMLYEGEIKKRSAFVMRFIDVNSRFDQKRVDNYNAISQVAGIKSNSKLNESLSLKDGDLIIKSSYLKDNFDKKLISRHI